MKIFFLCLLFSTHAFGYKTPKKNSAVISASATRQHDFGHQNIYLFFVDGQARLQLDSNFLSPTHQERIPLGVFWVSQSSLKSKLRHLRQLSTYINKEVSDPIEHAAKKRAPHETILYVAGYELGQYSPHREDVKTLFAEIWKMADWQTVNGIEVEYKKGNDFLLIHRQKKKKKKYAKVPLNKLNCRRENTKRLCRIPKYGTIYLPL